MSETKRRAKYTLEFKLEAVRLVKGGQVASVTAKRFCRVDGQSARSSMLSALTEKA